MLDAWLHMWYNLARGNIMGGNIMKKFITLAILSAMTLTMLTGCSGKSSSKDESQTFTVSEAAGLVEAMNEPVVVDEPDAMAYLLGESDTVYIGMSVKEFEKATGGTITEKNASKYNKDDGVIYEEFSLGKKDSILGGRLSLGDKYDQKLVLTFKDDKLKEFAVTVTGLTKEQSTAICDSFIDTFDGKLIKGYEKTTVSEHGKRLEKGFGKGRDDYIATMTRDDTLDGDYIARFSMQIYSERYGM